MKGILFTLACVVFGLIAAALFMGLVAVSGCSPRTDVPQLFWCKYLIDYPEQEGE